jgi:hypothetical protein
MASPIFSDIAWKFVAYTYPEIKFSFSACDFEEIKK